jgi:hypothetical protein
MLFGMLDELATAWVLAGADGGGAAADRPGEAIAPTGPGTRPKKFDIVRAADWVVALITSGLSPATPRNRAPKEQP